MKLGWKNKSAQKETFGTDSDGVHAWEVAGLHLVKISSRWSSVSNTNTWSTFPLDNPNNLPLCGGSEIAKMMFPSWRSQVYTHRDKVARNATYMLGASDVLGSRAGSCGATSHLTACPCKSTSTSQVIAKIHEWMDTFEMNPERDVCRYGFPPSSRHAGILPNAQREENSDRTTYTMVEPS